MKIVTNLVEVHIFREKEKQLQFLILKRAAKEIYPGLWQMVSGKIKKKEKAYCAALREMKEETSLTPLKFWAAPNINSFYDSSNDTVTIIPVFASLVDPKSEVIISHEHDEFRWVSIDVAKKKLAWEGQRKSVDFISKYYLKQQKFFNFVEIKRKD
ncbi:MAG: NUDIX hydrolase [Ignavibacteriaceae bacterium]